VCCVVIFTGMRRPLHAYLETQSVNWLRSIAAAQDANPHGDTLIHVIMVPGDHYSAFPKVVRRYLVLIESEGRQ